MPDIRNRVGVNVPISKRSTRPSPPGEGLAQRWTNDVVGYVLSSAAGS